MQKAKKGWKIRIFIAYWLVVQCTGESNIALATLDLFLSTGGSILLWMVCPWRSQKLACHFGFLTMISSVWIGNIFVTCHVIKQIWVTLYTFGKKQMQIQFFKNVKWNDLKSSTVLSMKSFLALIEIGFKIAIFSLSSFYWNQKLIVWQHIWNSWTILKWVVHKRIVGFKSFSLMLV